MDFDETLSAHWMTKISYTVYVHCRIWQTIPMESFVMLYRDHECELMLYVRNSYHICIEPILRQSICLCSDLFKYEEIFQFFIFSFDLVSSYK